jgi:HD-like signal output (HDOD) protein
MNHLILFTAINTFVSLSDKAYVELGTLSRKDHAAKLEWGLGILPPFSPVLMKVLASLADENVSVAGLGDWIERDTVLAGRVLRHVNSAAYGCSREVSSIRHAVAIMGLAKLRNLALTLSVCRMWDKVRLPQGWSAARFNMHSVATATMCDLLAQHLEAECGEMAFTSGLLHDIGKVLIAVSLPDAYLSIESRVGTGGLSWEECEQEMLGVTHEAISAAVLVRWNLPAPIREAVSRHHLPPPEPSAMLETWSLGQLISISDRVANMMGVSIAHREEAALPDTRRALAIAGLESLAAELADRFDQEFETIRACF